MDIAKERERLHLLVIAVIVAAVFANTMSHTFVWDDTTIIARNPLLASLANIPKFFLMEDVADGTTGYYRPVTYISFALDHALWGGNPLGFNITNLLLHIAVALLLYRVVARLFHKTDLALTSAAIFALHPITVETVNFHAGGRNTLLCACFALLSLLCFMKRKDIPAVACFAAAVFSKEFALLQPAVFLLYEITISKEKIRWTRYLPFALVAAGYLALRSQVVASNGNLLQAADIANSFWIVPQTMIGYLQLMLLPFSIKTMYDVNNQITWTSFMIYSLLLLALVAVAVLFRKRREIVFAIFMFLLFLLPVSNIFPLGSAMMADRYAYFALLGFSIGAGYCVTLLDKRLAFAGAALLLTCFAVFDVRQNTFWKDEISLFTKMVDDAPLMCIGYQNLGYAFYTEGDYPLARKYLAAAQNKKDMNVTDLTSNALSLMELGRNDLALTAINRAITLEPKHPQGHAIAAGINEELHNEAQAKWHREQASALKHDIFATLQQSADTSCRKAEAQMARGDLVKAERLYYSALACNVRHLPAVAGMAAVSAKAGKTDKARYYLERAGKLELDNPKTRYQLSGALREIGEARQPGMP
jgi:protein O-mannosyl-transferase